MKNLRKCSAAALVLWSTAAGAKPLSVATRSAFFNPTLGQAVQLDVTVGNAGQLVAEILDRDRVVIRTLAPQDALDAGVVRLRWDGRDDAGNVVPNEAYSLRVKLFGQGREEIYDPGAGFTPKPESVLATSYSRSSGILSYSLRSAARVHIQAGQAKVNPKTGQPEGPVLKTLADRQPRVAGAVIEKWNGFDESGRIYVPDLPDFVIAVFTAPLPENSIITVGSRGQSFAEYALATRPREATVPRALRKAGREHHAGLNALEDRSPRVTIEAASGLESTPGGWRTGGELPLKIAVDPAAAPYFFNQTTELVVFVDSKRVAHITEPGNPVEITIAASDLPPGEHRIVANWISKSGPVGVNALKIVAPPRVAGKVGAR